MSKLTVIPADKLIICNGIAIQFEFSSQHNLRALQWEEDKGHMEFDDAPNKKLDMGDYSTIVQPYIDAFAREKARLEAEERRKEQERQEKYNSEEQRFVRLRAERDKRLAATDYLVMVDYPIGDNDLQNVKAYRKALRDLPGKPGSPWTDDTIPWPVKPAM